MGKNLWLRAEANANLKPELKTKVVWNTCDKTLGGEPKSCSSKLLQNFTLKLSEAYVKYFEKNSRYA